MDRWRGKNAMVTGANSGIGAAIAEKLLDLGFSVIGLDKRTENLIEMKKFHAKGAELYVLNVDLNHEEEVIRGFEWAEESIGGIDVLVNSAGLGGTSTLLGGNVNEWRNMLNVNVIALCLCSKEAIKSMQKRNVGGHIIHLSSNAGHIIPEYGPFHFYAATKHAVKALTEGLRQELKQADSSIKVTSISPGIVKTPIVKNCLGEEIDKLVYERNPFLNVQDIANAVQYILETPPHVQVHDLIIKPLGAHN